MKKRIIKTVAFVMLAVSLLSYIAIQAGLGGLYTNVSQGENAATNNVRGAKVGKSSVSTYLGLIAIGDASVNTAAQNGGITRISHVDSQKKSILGIVTSTTTIVYGE